MSAVHHQEIFGHTRLPHTIIVAKGEDVRHFTVRRPWLIGGAAAAATSVTATLIAAGVLWATGSAPGPVAATPPGETVAAYETRIASLRSEVDRLTTRGFIDRQKVSGKLDLLLSQQAQLAERYTKLQPLLDRAKASGLLAGHAAPGGTDITPKLPPVPASRAEALSFAEPARPEALDRFKLVDLSASPASTGAVSSQSRGDSIPPELIREIGRSMDEAELDQIDGLASLAERARDRSQAIGAVLAGEGLGAAIPKPARPAGQGGPFVEVPRTERFDAGVQDLASALDALQAATDATASLPLAAPVPSAAVSSTFGIRPDPFLNRAAMHTGIDFVAETGSAAHATAPGTVTFAGANGTYGQMVEIDHGRGLATRYAHLSRIAVGVGQRVVAGTVVGRVGSTGRSTGPHLHYELRRAGEAVDPSRYLRAGRRIEALG